MKVILTENVEGLGTIGDLVKVKPGYARNFLVPRKMAVEASTRNIKELEHQKRQAERKLQRVVEAAEVLKSRIEKFRISVTHRAGEEGKLFGSVTSMEIAEQLAAGGIEVDRRRIDLKEPIKSLGTHEVPIKLEAGVTASLKVEVNPLETEAAEAAPVSSAE